MTALIGYMSHGEDTIMGRCTLNKTLISKQKEINQIQLQNQVIGHQKEVQNESMLTYLMELMLLYDSQTSTQKLSHLAVAEVDSADASVEAPSDQESSEGKPPGDISTFVQF